MSQKAIGDMKKHVKWNILIKNHSKGSLYRGLEEFEPYMEDQYIRITEKIQKANEEETQVLTRLGEEKSRLEQLQESNQAHQQQKEELTITITQFEDKLASIKKTWETKSTRLTECARGKLVPWIEFASILYGVNQDPVQMQHVNLSVVRRIGEGIHFFISRNCSSSKVRIPKEISNREFGMLAGSEYHLHSISEILVEGLSNLEREMRQ